MHLMDSLFRWLIDQIVTAIDMFGMSILSVLGADLTLFVNIFPIVETTYEVFVVTALTLLGLNMVWGIFKNFFMPIGVESEPPVQLVAKSIIFGFLAFFIGISARFMRSFVRSIVLIVIVFSCRFSHPVHRSSVIYLYFFDYS